MLWYKNFSRPYLKHLNYITLLIILKHPDRHMHCFKKIYFCFFDFSNFFKYLLFLTILPFSKDFDPTNMNYASQCHSHTIAFIVYMCLRYADDINNEKMVRFF